MTQVDPKEKAPVQLSDGVTRFAVHREGDANIWYCEAHTFVRLLIDGKPVCWHEVCVTCGQESHHPVHDVRAYGLIHPKP